MYGFHNKLEMNMFKLLQTIQGIGPKASLSILSSLDVDQIVLGITSSDKSVFLKADGIGSRVATRIISELNEKNVSRYLQTKDIPDPDLLIRTGDTKRLSNFLLWQLAYSEIFFEKKLWPDFNEKDYSNIIRKFRNIKRNYGNI